MTTPVIESASLVDAGRDHAPLLLHMLLDRGARVQPNNLLVTKTQTGYAELTFRGHQELTLQIGSALAQWGVQLGDRIGTLMWNSAHHLQCAHAISCVGAVLHTLNARLGARDLSFTVANARDRVILVDEVLLDVLASLDEEALSTVELVACQGTDGAPVNLPLLQPYPNLNCVDFQKFLAAGSVKFRWPSFPEIAPHYLCYTSGSTSNPKGVVYSHRSTYLALMTMGLSDQYGVDGSMVLSAFVPMFHILSWGVPFLSLMLGARTVFQDRFTNSDQLLDMLIEWRIEWSAAVPAVWQALRDAIVARGIEAVRDKIALRKALSGGSAPSIPTMQWYRQQLGLEFMQGWGMTETNPIGTNAKYVNTFDDRAKDDDEQFANLTKSGLPVPGMEFRIVDPNNLDVDMPDGEAGELLARGPLVITQYFQGEGADKFHKGWLLTGDVARFEDDGTIVVCDRTKDFIKSGGEWISSISLEDHIAKHPDVGMVAVVGVLHPRWDERPVAIITLANGSHAKPGRALTESIRSHCSDSGGFVRFQLPDDVLVWKQLPLNSTNKLDKKAIRVSLTNEGYVLHSAAVNHGTNVPSKL